MNIAITPAGMNPQHKPAAKPGVAQNPRKHTLKRLDLPVHNDHACPAVNLQDSAQDIDWSHWQIILRHGIAARDPLRIVGVDQPVNKNALPSLY
jgi:hypothetical protein